MRLTDPVSVLTGADFVETKKVKKMDSLTNVTKQENELLESYAGTNPNLSMAFHHGLIDRLFARFGAMYGNKFLDMWANVDMGNVKKYWGDELRIFSIEQIGIAVVNLKNKTYQTGMPPTLPEFIQLCESARAQKPRIYTAPSLPQLSQASESQERTMRTAPQFKASKANNDWAHRLMKRHESGEKLPVDSLRMAREALK